MTTAIGILKDMKHNMEGVHTISVPYHIKQIDEAIANCEQLQAEIEDLKTINYDLNNLNDDLMAECDGAAVIRKLQAELDNNKIEANKRGSNEKNTNY